MDWLLRRIDSSGEWLGLILLGVSGGAWMIYGAKSFGIGCVCFEVVVALCIFCLSSFHKTNSFFFALHD